jgi:hypothetical protein
MSLLLYSLESVRISKDHQISMNDSEEKISRKNYVRVKVFFSHNSYTKQPSSSIIKKQITLFPWCESDYEDPYNPALLLNNHILLP